MKKESREKKHGLLHNNHEIITGATSDKYAVLLDDGKTIVFISDKSKEAEARQKYKQLGLYKRI